MRGNIIPTLRNVSLAHICPPSQPVLLWSSYSNLWQNIKTALALFPGAGQYPRKLFQHSSPSAQQLLLCSRRTVASAADQGSC